MCVENSAVQTTTDRDWSGRKTIAAVSREHGPNRYRSVRCDGHRQTELTERDVPPHRTTHAAVDFQGFYQATPASEWCVSHIAVVSREEMSEEAGKSRCVLHALISRMGWHVAGFTPHANM